MTDRQLKEEAADIVRNTVPNYAYVSDLVKALRSTPFGNFASFPTAIMNSAVGIGSRIRKEIVHSKPTIGPSYTPLVMEKGKGLVKNDNPLYGIGFKRLLGSAAAFGSIGVGLGKGYQSIFGTGTAGSNSGKFYFAISSGAVRIGGGANVYLVTNRLLRDSSSWYHLVCAVDTSQATSSNRIKFYINGVQETSFSTRLNPELNRVSLINYQNYTALGNNGASGNYFDGSLSHVHFCDNQLYQASDFGSFDSTTGEWKINTSPNVNYGTTRIFCFKRW